MVQYSVIIPLYNEEEIFAELFQRIKKTMDGFGETYEIIFVDDGSEDSTFSLISDLAKNNPNVLAIKLSKNFGQDNANLAGMKCSSGENIILMDGDLQDPPEFIPNLIKEKNKGYSVVYGVKTQRKENFLIRSLTSIFYKLMHFLSNVQIPQNAGTFSIISRAVAGNILSLRENNKFVSGLRSYVGFKQSGISYNREKRNAGKPKSLFDLIRMGLNAIFSFSILPLRITILTTLIMSVITFSVLFLSSFQQFSNKFVGFGTTKLIIICIFALFFLLLLSLTIVSEYIARLHEQIKRRPDFIIELIIKDGREIRDFHEIIYQDQIFLKLDNSNRPVTP